MIVEFQSENFTFCEFFVRSLNTMEPHVMIRKMCRRIQCTFQSGSVSVNLNSPKYVQCTMYIVHVQVYIDIETDRTVTRRWNALHANTVITTNHFRKCRLFNFYLQQGTIRAMSLQPLTIVWCAQCTKQYFSRLSRVMRLPFGQFNFTSIFNPMLIRI